MFALYRKVSNRRWFVVGVFRMSEYATVHYTYKYDRDYQIRSLSHV